MALRTRIQIALVALALLVLAAIMGVWHYREPIARDMLNGYFAQRGIPISYKIKAIETRRQRLEQVRIGDPRHPDLIADWVEIDVGPSFTGLSVKAFRAGGLRLWGLQKGKKISFGSVDRLLPPPSDAPFRLPRIDLVLEDARLALESPYGRIGIRLDGQGNLRSGFEGTIALVSPQLRAKGCAATGLQIYGDIAVVGARPTYVGPARFAGLQCGDVSAGAASLKIDASLSEAADNWRGAVQLTSLNALSGPSVRIVGMTGGGEFSGDATKTLARFEAQARGVAASQLNAAKLELAAKAVVGRRGVRVNGRTIAFGLQANRHFAKATQRVRGLRQAPVLGPLAQQLGHALSQAGAGIKADARFAWSHIDGLDSASLGDVRLSAPGGGFLQWSGKEALSYDAAGVRLAGAARFGGGGLPAGRAQFAGRSGQIIMAPYRAKGAEVRATPIAILLTSKGVGFDTELSLYGPLPNGRVTGLRFPVRIMPGQSIPQGCFPVRVQRLVSGAVRIDAAQVRTCSLNQGITLAAPRFSGRLNGAPLRLTSGEARLDLRTQRAAARALRINWGQGAEVSNIRLDQVTAQPTRRGFEGQITGLEGQLGGIPLAVQKMTGVWRIERANLVVSADAMVADRSATPRFLPMRAADISARLAQGVLSATTHLREPVSNSAIADVSLKHDLASSHGFADINVPGLTFGPALQPDALTPVTKGVVANVLGSVSGTGRIDWAQGQVSSAGRFQTSGLDFAAAFGPVRGLAGDIQFSDLIGLVTKGVQQARVAAVNPGVEVTAGVIRYRLLPDFKVAVEGARWPFAGGALILEPTILDMSQSAQRRLTFRAEGLDAARFIAAMEFENIAASGVYDGVLPMVFDAQGGRIEGGRLVARGGGTVSYVGPISNENLGLMGRFAFDALKSMRYSRLAIDLNGAIDGDVITRVSFAGVNQAPVAGGRTKLPIKILGASNIPFVFNVTITAKFRQLFDMARSVNDPSVFINRAYPKLQADPASLSKPEKPIQPTDSPKR